MGRRMPCRMFYLYSGNPRGKVPPPLNYAKKGQTIDLAFWRAPERLSDEPDELMACGRALRWRRRTG